MIIIRPAVLGQTDLEGNVSTIQGYASTWDGIGLEIGVKLDDIRAANREAVQYFGSVEGLINAYGLIATRKRVD